jgi:hypothetical protein
MGKGEINYPVGRCTELAKQASDEKAVTPSALA